MPGFCSALRLSVGRPWCMLGKETTNGLSPSPCDEFIRLGGRSVSVAVIEYQRLSDSEGTEIYFPDLLQPGNPEVCASIG